MNVGQLIEALSYYEDSTPVVLRVIELGEVQLTSDLCETGDYEGAPLLIGELRAEGA